MHEWVDWSSSYWRRVHAAEMRVLLPQKIRNYGDHSPFLALGQIFVLMAHYGHVGTVLSQQW